MRRLLPVLLGLALAAGAWLLLAGRLSPEPALPAGDVRSEGSDAREEGRGEERRRRRVPRVRCPRGVPRCLSVRGQVAFVESVDPDGDGDLHVVLLGGNVTAPGLTAVDIRPGLRPRRDPRVGDVVSAAGPVQRGSFGQDQIHALRVRFAR